MDSWRIESIMVEISGFTLFALCHHFGRRGRAMLRSLAQQVQCPVPLKIFIYYCRTEDAQLLLEGAAAGPSPLALELLRTDPARILQRAMHFSRAQDLSQYSHSVFCDADLRFPPTFWSEYVEAIKSEEPGYWSCRVMNVPWPGSEVFVEKWMEVGLPHLERATTGRHRDDYAGHVGHFQCIPRNLLVYPADPRPSVDKIDLEFSKAAIERSQSRRRERRLGRPSVYHLDHPPSWSGTGGLQL